MATPIDWLREAEEDLAAVRNHLQGSLWKHACWQPQQAAEKALKAILLKLQGSIPKTHDLADLLARIRSKDPGFRDAAAGARILTKYYGMVRYPDTRPPGWTGPTSVDAQEALRLAEEIVNDARSRIP